jgi:clan AA aspartic protease
MGEVKVQVKLSNGMDLGMFRRGLITREQVRSVNVEAVADTGAVRSRMPVDVMEKLGLQAVRQINAQTANGQTQSVEVTEGVDMEILDRLVTEAFLVLGSEVLIGQTALEATDLLVDCNRQQVIPNPAHPNSAVIRIR